MTGCSNVTFHELEVGTTASSERVLGRPEFEALLLGSGDVVPFHVRMRVGSAAVAKLLVRMRVEPVAAAGARSAAGGGAR